MKWKNILKMPVLFLAGSAILTTTVMQISSCGKKKVTPPAKNTWALFEEAALKASASDLYKQIPSITKYHWKTSDKANFEYDGAPNRKGSEQEIIAIIVIQNQDEENQFPINFDIKYQDGAAYDVTNWTYSQDPELTTWSEFETSALNETATNLKNQISDVTKYHWTKSMVAVFSEEGHPKIMGSKQEIVATIVIKGKTEGTDFPINFDIKFKKSTYHLKDWTYDQSSTIEWDQFKGLALKMSPADLLAGAQKSEDWKYMKWTGNPTESVWQTNDVPEFDVYGGTGATDDPYKGMDGQLIADYDTKTISAIISIKDREGVYNANPIHATIIDDGDTIYNIQNWAFNQTQQHQSKLKYLGLTNDVIALANQMTGNSDKWDKFSTENFIGNDHKNTLLDFLSSNGYPGVIGTRSRTDGSSAGVENSAKTALDTFINIKFNTEGQPIVPYHKKLTCSFEYITITNKNVGLCFSYSWSISDYS